MKYKVGTLLFLALVCVAATSYPGDILFKGVLQHQSGDAGYLKLSSNCVTDTTDSGAGTHVLTGVIPADVLSLGVSCRVDTVIAGAGAASFSLGDGTDADLYGAGIAFAAGTVVDSTNYTASPMTQAWSTSAGDLTLTANAGQFDSGVITCCAHYLESIAPTS